MLSIFDSLEFDNLIQPDDFGTMNTGKFRWVQPFLHRVHCFAQKMHTTAGVQLRVVVCLRRSIPIHLLKRYESSILYERQSVKNNVRRLGRASLACVQLALPCETCRVAGEHGSEPVKNAHLLAA